MAEDQKPSTDEDDDEDTLAAFKRILGKVLPEWETLTKPKTDNPPNDGPSNSLAAFLEKMLADARAEGKKLSDRLEQMMEVLTPEQLTSLREKRRAADASPEGHGAPKQEPSKKPQEPSAAPKKRAWL